MKRHLVNDGEEIVAMKMMTTWPPLFDAPLTEDDHLVLLLLGDECLDDGGGSDAKRARLVNEVASPPQGNAKG